ncbi:hypothetical protein [Mesorhizobium sp. B2-5-7]|uniref:hypothetical protein n=1 Tax=Mesorhizobium sp. B2-5-7 TaxID=2589923 RepID=UPI001129DA67|nr:hypothetical protein [Mesorhizobium sp. B2-5-7]TPK11633.1 hypothetical protein FJ543_19800 [Mesorhizobium sp. B2-5-7]
MSKIINISFLSRASFFVAACVLVGLGISVSPAQAANTCVGGQSKITNKTCDAILYVFACYGDGGASGHGAQSLQKGQSADFNFAPNSTFAAVCGTPPAEKCDATWCADGKDHEY